MSKRKTARIHSISTLEELYSYCTTRFEKRQMSEMIDTDVRYTYGSFRKTCDSISQLLSRYGIGSSDRVAILSQNTPNWTVAFFSLVAFGRVAVPILPDSSANEISNILAHSGSKALFVSKRFLSRFTDEQLDKLNLVIDIETLDIIRRKREAFTCDGRPSVPGPDDMAAIIYTSGTTGNAKGVMLSHRNFCTNITISYHAHRTSKRDVWLSILPMPHTYELTIGVLYPMSVGGKVCYLQKPPTASVLLHALKTVRPTIMLSVPLIIEKMYKSSVVPSIEKSTVLRWMRDHTPWLLWKLVGKRLKKTFGGRIKFFGVGGAKLDSNVEAFLKRIHFHYAIGYGMTECAPLICTAGVKQTHVGTTGGAAYGVDVKLKDVDPATGEGEIIVKGNNVMMGYYKDPDRTASVFTSDGWFRTGDLATIDEKGRFSIRGRMGSVIIGPSGENIYPEEIEHVINDLEGVDESLVVDDDGKLVALVQLNKNVLDWDHASEEQFFERLQAQKEAVLRAVNKQVSRFSQISRVEIQKEPFSKTATQKIRRFLYKKSATQQNENAAGMPDEKQTPHPEIPETKPDTTSATSEKNGK
ncbi:MAG: AMP-binding protein [Bacteroidaceae bacterium]|nr:AMP-binding protein [Bacteroidaceae bacterium]